MTLDELKSSTVLELRKLAKENGIVLGTGLPKADIIRKISAVLCPPADDDFTIETTVEAPSVKQVSPISVVTSSNVEEKPIPKYSAKPAYQAPISYQARPSWQSSPASTRSGADNQTWQAPPARPTNFTPRFGPAASQPPKVQSYQPTVTEEESSDTVQSFTPAPSAVLPERRFGGGFGPSAVSDAKTRTTPPTFSPSGFSRTPVYSSAPAARTTASWQPSTQRQESPYMPPQPQELGITPPTLEELLASGDYVDGEGILELHPDGYGFLRSKAFLPSSRDIYISMAQIRRFMLRSGDLIAGKVRSQREGDKYSAMLYITSVNGIPMEEATDRVLFDDLTPIYPTRHIDLQPHDRSKRREIRLIDLIAPIGFGQRGLLLCPPETGKRDLIRDMANTITENYPDVQVMVLLIDMTPEDVTLIRDQITCQVLASTFDQSPENHLRLAELVLERAMRLVEQKKDVVIFADSLTKLAKIYSTAAAQQGRSLPGMVNPTSLFKAKHLFGSARCMKEGGSLTVIASMDIHTGSKVDDSVVEEFKGTANMELTLDEHVARQGIKPALNLQQSFTKNTDILLDDAHLEGLRCVRAMIGQSSSATVIPQLMNMMDKVDTNADLLLKMKDWFAMMNKK